MSRIGHHQPTYPDLAGAFRKSYQLEMITDRTRVRSICMALRRTLRPESVFCEVGCGSGIFAVEAGKICKRAYALESDPVMAEIAEANIRKADMGDRIQLIVGDALEVKLPEKVDLALCELMSIWAVVEPLVPVANRIREDLLKRGGTILPLRVVNCVELGNYQFTHNGVTMRTSIPLFTGVQPATRMTERKVCRVLDFSGRVEEALDAEARFEVPVEGIINCAVLTSLVQMGPGIVFSGSDTLMPPTVVPLQEEVRVHVGDHVKFRAVQTARTSLASGSVEAWII